MKSNSLNWGPPISIYNLDSNTFTKVKNIKPEFKFDKDDEIFLTNPILGRYNYSDSARGEMKEYLDPYIRDYMKNTMIHNKEIANRNFDQLKFSFSNLWANDYKNNQTVTPHIHSCDIGFLVYLKVDSELLKKETYPSGCTVFRYGEERDARALIPYLVNNFITPKEGELLIFPNNVNHYTVPFDNPNIKRITLSGNIDVELSNW